MRWDKTTKTKNIIPWIELEVNFTVRFVEYAQELRNNIHELSTIKSILCVRNEEEEDKKTKYLDEYYRNENENNKNWNQRIREWAEK